MFVFLQPNVRNKSAEWEIKTTRLMSQTTAIN